ncbi:MAG: DUF4271 domain-containing protein [Flavobacteriaceae bacterium]
MEPRLVVNQDWIVLILLGVFMLLAILKAKFPRRFHEFLLLPITDKYFSLEGKNTEVTHPFSLLLFLVQAISFSLFISLFLAIRNEQASPTFLLFIQVFTGFTLVILAKYYIEKLIAHILDIEKSLTDYFYKKLSYINLFAIVLLGINLIFYFVHSLGASVFYIFCIGFGFLYFMTLLSSFRKNTHLILGNFFYFILYLCALEIAPYMILYKLVV